MNKLLFIIACAVKDQAESDVFVLTSDSDSSPDMSELLEKLTAKKPFQKKKFTKKKFDMTALHTDSQSIKSSPLQRSIRRYGKIKKSVQPFSPSPLVIKNVSKLLCELA